MEILRTERLRLREFTPADADFVLGLLNEPGWLENINDPGVRTPQEALTWMEGRFFEPYRAQGHGFWAVERLEDGQLLGLCGLFRRPVLDGPDLGYALRRVHEGQGYALEAAQACVQHARTALRWPELLAITKPGNVRSPGLLTKLGFVAEGERQLEGYDGPSSFWRMVL